MDIIESLIEDHLFFKDRLSQLRVLAQGEDLGATRAVAIGLVKEVRKRQKVHLQRETEVLFPAMREALTSLRISPIDPSILFHLQEEHVGIGRTWYLLQQELERNPPGPWKDALSRAGETLVAHVDSEDQRVFPQAARVIPKEELERMTRRSGFLGE